MSDQTVEVTIKHLNRIADSLEDLTALKISKNDALYAAMLDGTNTERIFRLWWDQSEAGGQSKYTRLSRFARMLAAAYNGQKYTIRKPIGASADLFTPIDDLADLGAAQLCTEATAPVAGWEDNSAICGWYVRANAYRLADGTMEILYVEGENGFDITGELAPVYTFAPALYKREWEDTEHEYKSFSATALGGYDMQDRDIGLDGKKRDLTWTPSFPGTLNSSGGLTSGAGGKPANRMSANAGITNARKVSAYEGLWNDGDQAYVLDMWQMRHHRTENSGVCEGCNFYNYTYLVALPETGVKRVLLTAAQAANLQVGSNIMIGTNASTDRNVASSYSIADNATILSKETVTIDGTDYVALNLDVAEEIDTTETTQIMTAPWNTGTTEALPDHKDGACHSLTAGQNPIRVMGIEIIHGCCDIGLDPLYNVTKNEDNTTFDYEVFECRNATHLAGSITANYKSTGIIRRKIASGWNWVKSYVKTKLSVLFPEMLGGSSTTYYKSAVYGSASAGVRCPWRSGLLDSATHGGLSYEPLYNAPSYASCNGSPRLGGSGAMRGERAA